MHAKCVRRKHPVGSHGGNLSQTGWHVWCEGYPRICSNNGATHKHMKTNAVLIAALGLLFQGVAPGQGSLVYDQQSTSNSFFGNSGFLIETFQPTGQSFTPSFSAVGFVQFGFLDFPQNGQGASVIVNLREDSISGNVLATTSPVAITDGFSGMKTFFFPNQVAVVPNVTYYFQPVVYSGDLTVSILGNRVDYPGGTSFFGGVPHPTGIDLGFREGIVVSEPSTLSLTVIGAGFLLWGLGRRH